MTNDGEKIMSALAEANTVAVAGHINPDGDCVGACCALAQCLAKMWKSVFVLTDDYSEIFNCIPGREFRYTGDVSQMTPDVFVALDCGSEDRLGKYGEVYKRSKTTVNIDHHMSNTRFAGLNMVEEDASSTCQVLFDLINMYVLIDEGIAAALYSGIVYDTGGFRHKATSAKTHEIAARLAGVGFDRSALYNELLHTRSLREIKCFAKALGNMEVTADGLIVSSFLTFEELSGLGADGKDLEGIAEYLLSLRGSEAAVFAYAKSRDETKLSFRSKNADVGKIARARGGGGHFNAAGCNVSDNARAAAALAVSMLKNEL